MLRFFKLLANIQSILNMISKKFKIIQGGRDSLEASLVEALFKIDTAEVDRISEQINAIQQSHPSKLALIKFPIPKQK